MKIKILNLLVITMLVVPFILPVKSAGVVSDPLDKVSTAFQNGNARALARFFDSTVRISFNNEESRSYSKAQAEQVINDFFNRHKPSSFQIVHQGSSGGNSMYGIGNLETQRGNYRVNLYYRGSGSEVIIFNIKFAGN